MTEKTISVTLTERQMGVITSALSDAIIGALQFAPREDCFVSGDYGLMYAKDVEAMANGFAKQLDQSVFGCVDCNVNTKAIDEYYSVHDHIWKKADIEPHGGMLCIGCLEKRLQERLMPQHFTDAPINHDWNQMSDRLRNRLTKDAA